MSSWRVHEQLPLFTQSHQNKRPTTVENTLGLVSKYLDKSQEPENGIDFEI
jgi:hypothetical protein